MSSLKLTKVWISETTSDVDDRREIVPDQELGEGHVVSVAYQRLTVVRQRALQLPAGIPAVDLLQGHA